MEAFPFLIGMLALGASPANGAPAACALAGSPEAIGSAWGRINASIIRGDMAANYLDLAAKEGVSRETLLQRAGKFVAICEEVAPHWLEEAEAVAKAADVDPVLYTAYMGCVYRKLWMGDECTSYAVSPAHTKDNAIFFHKNRDNLAKPQAACIVASNLPGINKFITVTDACVLACMMMVNDKGLAGAGDTGGLAPGTPRFRGMMNTFILRYIAERAATCAEAEAIIRDFVGKGYYAGGGTTGTHWLFVDATGAILEVSSNADEVITQLHDKKVYFSVRQDTPAAKTLDEATDPIDFHGFHNVSRHPSICFDSTISGMTVEISADHPESLTCAWLTFPGKGLAFPLFMGGRDTPLAFMNGEIYGLCAGVDCATTDWEKVEMSLYLNKTLAAERAADLLAQGEDEEAAASLEEWVSTTTNAHVALLRRIHGGIQK